ncbi:hypothetical protein SBRCBS47491_002182 [Sporothrix bragantina]|uniref:FAD-binding domain-containing protein n=1 Tax=Sporothrix bragantina TaxID=671064 RepID=A0ABP0B5F4_9PEZI
MPLSKVIVVGAGPSGLLLAILLAKAGVPVELLEQTRALDKNPRASHYTDSSCREFERAGVLDALIARGFFPNGVSWRKMDEQRTRLVRLINANPDTTDRYRMVCLPLDQLGILLETELNKLTNAVIRYDHKVVALKDDPKDSQVSLEVETPDGPRTFSADYVVGCDGGNSTMRKLLFGAGVFPGFTWDKQIVATNMYYDFDRFGYDDSQFFVHPEHWHMVAKIQADGLTRLTYGEIGGLTHEQLLERMPQKYATLLPGNATPDQWKVVNFSPYRVHQRCVDKMRVGRVLLAADAAHLCNPFGGMGLTGGIADIGSLFDSLAGIHEGKADDGILDIYCRERRRIWHEQINPISSVNMERLFSIDADEIVEKDPFINMVQKIERGELPPPPPGTPSVTEQLMYDMTQHYNK